MNIYVGNIAFSMTEDDLNELFSEFGEVTSCKIITDRETGRSRGFAFVEMAEQAEGENAIEALSNREMDGRRLKVNEARPREDRSGSFRKPRY
jgi:RNA recognition motif-containing protein